MTMLIENRSSEENYEDYLRAVYPLRCDYDNVRAPERKASILAAIRRLEKSFDISKEYSVYSYL